MSTADSEVNLNPTDRPLDSQPITEVPQQPQNIQPGELPPSPKDKPKSNPNLASLSPDDFNKCLQETLSYFNQKEVKVPDGRKGRVIGIDPRPMKGNSTRSGVDGNFLAIVVPRKALPGRVPTETIYHMPDDLELV